MNDLESGKQGLAGKRIVVTRARHQAPRLEAMIREFGGIPVAYPCIAIQPPPDPRPLANALRKLAEFDWLVITSGNTARALEAAITREGIMLDRARIKIAVIGDATRLELQRSLDADADFMPSRWEGAALAEGLPLQAGARLLLPQSDRADESLAQKLRARGASVQRRVAYQTVIASGGVDLPRLVALGEVDALTFASPSAVEFFRLRCPIALAQALPAACIGPVTGAAAIGQGFAQVIHPGAPGLRGMLRALAARL